ncbi:MAG TPA: YceD family protein [Gammaproteobacteria bacterium]
MDVVALAAEGATATRRYRLREFPRLADVLAGSGGEAEARFRFVQAAAEVAGCELEVRADASLRCERCLEPFVETLRSATRLAFVAGKRAAGGVPAGFEELALPSGLVSLRELVEDELLLSLPLVAKHGEGTACAQRAAPAANGDDADPQAGTRRPFAGLKELLKN